MPKTPPSPPPQATRFDDFAAVFRASDLAMGISSLSDGRFVDANRAFLRFFGYSRREVIGHTALELGLWPVPTERVRLLRLLRRGEPVTAYEARYRRKDGRIGEVSIAARLIESGGDTYLVGMLKDISARNRMDNALRESEARLRLAMRATHLPVFHQDRRLRYTWIVNPAMGLRAEDIVGRTDQEILGRAGGAELTRIKRRVLREARGAHQEVWLDRQGVSACFELTIEPEIDARGRVIGLLCASLDITERKRAEEAMRMQADILANLIEGVNLVDARGIIQYTNPSFDRLFGYAPGELVGQHVAILNADQVDPRQVADGILTALRRVGRWSGDLMNRRKDGGSFWTHARIACVRHPQLGEVYVSLQSDVSDLYRLRQERDRARHALERLAEHVQDQSETLRREIAREVHDEIGAALTGIGMRLDTKLRDLGHLERRDLKDLRDLRAQVEQALARSRELCSRLRPPILDDLGLVETCRWYLRDWSRQTGIAARGRFADLAVEPDDALRTDLFRILQELLTNVARHAEARRVDVTLSAPDRALRLRVRDNGHGFDPVRATGFGLPGIRERLRRHGGALRVDSGAQGTLMRVEIPARRP
jgi:PAS domain S-box-containing protein